MARAEGTIDLAQGNLRVLANIGTDPAISLSGRPVKVLLASYPDAAVVGDLVRALPDAVVIVAAGDTFRDRGVSIDSYAGVVKEAPAADAVTQDPAFASGPRRNTVWTWPEKWSPWGRASLF